MRMLTKGEDFIDVKAERAEADGQQLPVFCESFLYPRIGKADARFVLGVAQEYAYLISYLGTPAIKALLDVARKMVPIPDL